jgi:hypothetical protein
MRIWYGFAISMIHIARPVEHASSKGTLHGCFKLSDDVQKLKQLNFRQVGQIARVPL